MKASFLLLIAMLAAPLPAAAQAWREYRYSGEGFAVQFPAEPTQTKGLYKTTTGVTVPSVTYAVTADNVTYSVLVADFSKAELQDEPAIADAVKALGAEGEIKVDVMERINRYYGHQLALERKDGSRSTLAVFFIDKRLYLQDGRALPPDPASRSNRTSRFQQSLSFIN